VKKIGHAGTLDPMASGLMTLGVGQSTRLLTFLVGLDKTYDATIRLGFSTTTDDAMGEAIDPPASASDCDALTTESISAALLGFVGTIWQRPSAVSAIKVAGKRAYQRVREGEEVSLPEREVTIHQITIGSVTRVDDGWDVQAVISCSSGTYIRAIARDLGDKLGVGGHLTSLRRTMVGPWSVDDAVSADSLTPDSVLDPAPMITRVLPSVVVPRDQEVELSHGKRIRLAGPPDVSDQQPVAVMGQGGDLVAIVSNVQGPVNILVGLSGGGSNG
jgi:tRNA pseudouridine55 synthase